MCTSLDVFKPPFGVRVGDTVCFGIIDDFDTGVVTSVSSLDCYSRPLVSVSFGNAQLSFIPYWGDVDNYTLSWWYGDGGDAKSGPISGLKIAG